MNRTKRLAVQFALVLGLGVVPGTGCMVYEGEPRHHERPELREWHEHEGDQWHHHEREEREHRD